MITLLIFLVRYCATLLEKPGFKFKDSEIGRNDAEGSYLLLESVDVQLYISNEGEQITLEIRSVHDPRKRNWFSFDLLARLLGYEPETGVMNSSNSELLSRNLVEIISRFEKDKVAATIKELDELKSDRAKRI